MDERWTTITADEITSAMGRIMRGEGTIVDFGIQVSEGQMSRGEAMEIAVAQGFTESELDQFITHFCFH